MTEPIYHILLVDDDTEVLELNRRFFQQKGFEVSMAKDPEQAFRILEKEKVHCIVLDVMMPGMDGFEAFDSFRKRTEAPILFLTARTDEQDRIRGLLLGADDYITKPYSLEELSLRILINIRKSLRQEKNENLLEFPPLSIDLVSHKVFCSGQELFLSNREYEFLVLLVSHAGRELSFETIGEELFHSATASDRKNIMVTASRLRKKLEGNVGAEKMIETVWGKGYIFRA